MLYFNCAPSVKTKALLQLNTALLNTFIANFNIDYSDIKLLNVEGFIYDNTFPVIVYLYLHRLFTITALYILLSTLCSYKVEFTPHYKTYFNTQLTVCKHSQWVRISLTWEFGTVSGSRTILQVQTHQTCLKDLASSSSSYILLYTQT